MCIQLDEISTFCGGRVKTMMYHGSSRTKDPRFLAKHDVVVSTYGTVASEWPKKESRKAPGAVFSVQWQRVVLDEGNLNNPNNPSYLNNLNNPLDNPLDNPPDNPLGNPLVTFEELL